MRECESASASASVCVCVCVCVCVYVSVCPSVRLTHIFSEVVSLLIDGMNGVGITQRRLLKEGILQ